MDGGNTAVVVSVVGGTLAILTTMWHGWRKFNLNVIDPIMLMVADWRGSPGRPSEGVPAQLSVMARIYLLERSMTKVVGELSPNGGGSVYDKVGSIKTTIDQQGVGPQ